MLLVVCAIVELRSACHCTSNCSLKPWAGRTLSRRRSLGSQYSFGHEQCNVCLQLGLALLVEAIIGGTTIAWISTSTTLQIQKHRAKCWLPSAGDPAPARGAKR